MKVARAQIMIAAILGLIVSDNAAACANLTKAGERRQRQEQERYLQKEADKKVTGSFRADPAGRSEDGDLPGVIEVRRGKRVELYRVTIRGEINCGFPYYFLKDGDRGIFYLKRDDYPNPDDRDDGYIDNFSYLHFRSTSRPQD